MGLSVFLMRDLEEIKQDLKEAMERVEYIDSEISQAKSNRDITLSFVKEYEQELAMHNNQTT